MKRDQQKSDNSSKKLHAEPHEEPPAEQHVEQPAEPYEEPPAEPHEEQPAKLLEFVEKFKMEYNRLQNKGISHAAGCMTILDNLFTSTQRFKSETIMSIGEQLYPYRDTDKLREINDIVSNMKNLYAYFIRKNKANPKYGIDDISNKIITDCFKLCYYYVVNEIGVKQLYLFNSIIDQQKTTKELLIMHLQGYLTEQKND